MERFIHDDRTGLDYELVGDCYLIAGEDEPASPSLGLWGRRRADYLKQHRRTLYYPCSMTASSTTTYPRSTSKLGRWLTS